ncbi:helix-turn-helix domain-containing protein [Klebsiella pneumoniae]|uniref:helix-turn-helix domain-containing protein n=1 Tax=Klebsiella TaxID=570 RepID=UPI003007EB45
MNATLSSDIGEKIRLIREAEGLTRQQFFELTNIPIGTQKYYETGRRDGVGSDILLRITQHERLEKYTLWLMTGNTAPDAGQIAPALSLDGPEAAATSRRSARKTG